MKKEIAELLVKNGDGLEIYGNYSGRGMYGSTTTAITCDTVEDFLRAVGETYNNMILDAMYEGNGYDNSMSEDLADTLANFRKDSLGLGIIVY